VDSLNTTVEPTLGLDAALRQDRMLAIGGLSAVVLLSWLYLWLSASGMDHAAMAVAPMPRAASVGALTLTFVMWTIMMAGMMLPSAAPAILVYGALVRKHSAAGGKALPAVSTFVAGYLLVWTIFSLAATLLQAVLEYASLLTPDMASASTRLSALALIAAGVYQLTPLKTACLGKCQSPLPFFLTRWRDGVGGALRMGLEHGAYCVGCCWALMLLLFVTGVMNLLGVALITAFVFIEKIFPGGRRVTLTASATLILSGLYLLIRT
jgi:predicted metal-binding membrane protein